MKKRLLAIVMSLMMVVVFIPTVAFGEGEANTCKIGEQGYPTLADAVNAVASGGSAATTISMIDNEDVTTQIEITSGKSIELDLNGKTIEYKGSSLRGGVILVHNAADLSITDSSFNKTGVIKSGNDAYAAISVTKQGDSADVPAKLTINNGTLEGYYYAVVGNGNRNNTQIVINGGTLKGTNAEGSSGIYHPQEGTLTVNGGTITGYDTAVEMRAGTLDINGGDFKATSTTFSCTPNGSGTTTVGAAIAIAQHTTKKDITVDISKGTFTGKKALNESNPQENDPDPKVNLAVSGGTFNGEVSTTDVKEFVSGGKFSSKLPYEYCAKGYVPTQEADAGYYGVESFGNTHAAITAEISDTAGKLNTADTVIAVNKTDAAKYSSGLVEDATVKVALKTTDVSNQSETTGTQANAINKALSANQTMSYYIDAAMSYQVGTNEPSTITETSAYQTLAFDITGLDSDKVIVLRAHGTTPTVTKIAKVNYADFAAYDGECYCIKKTESTQSVLVKANKFSVYGIGTQTTSPAATCEVTFNYNYDSKVSTTTATVGGTITPPAEPTRTGYIFKGWYKEAACTNEWNFSTAITGNTTLYAKWVEAKTVTFNANGHGTAPAKQTVEKGTLAKEPTAPTATGYAFKGWYKESTCVNAWNFTTDKVTADVTLYAKWVAATEINDYTVVLSTTRYIYDGKGKTPTVKLVDKTGKEIAASNYDVIYSTGCAEIGSYTVTVVAKGEYVGTAKATFVIVPNAPALRSVSKGKKSFTAKWAKNSEKITKYQMRYSSSSKFKRYKTKNYKSTTTKAKIKGLKSKKTYYVKIRAYKTVSGANYYSNWSRVMKVKTR